LQTFAQASDPMTAKIEEQLFAEAVIRLQNEARDTSHGNAQTQQQQQTCDSFSESVPQLHGTYATLS
jgi:hypothetical protein